ncbi:MAG: protein DA1 [Planctomycetota bacterium]
MLKKLGSLFLFCLLCLSLVVLFDPQLTRISSLYYQKCAECHLVLEGEFRVLGDQAFHPYHFYCAFCSIQILEDYKVNQDLPYHPVCLKIKQKEVCDFCHEPFVDALVEHLQHNYHPDCLTRFTAETCGYCKRELYGKYYLYQKKNYHAICYETHIAPHCAICQESILGEYLEDYWKYPFHKHHKDVPSCWNCNRRICEAITAGGKTLEDQRQVCGICWKSAITTQEQLQPLLTDIRKKMEAWGLILQIKEFSVDLVFQPELQKRAKFLYTPKLGGLTESQLIYHNENLFELKFQVSILWGLEENLFQSILIHELVHIWVKENRKSALNRQIEEGFANYLSFLLLQTRDNLMSHYLTEMIEKNTDPIYGDGFRKVKERIQQIGIAPFQEQLKSDLLWK